MSQIPKIATGCANCTGWVPLVIVTDRQGILHSVGIADAHLDEHQVRIVIDGQELGSGKLAASKKSAGNNGIGLGLPFSDSLRIKIRDVKGATTVPTFWASYVIKTNGS